MRALKSLAVILVALSSYNHDLSAKESGGIDVGEAQYSRNSKMTAVANCGSTDITTTVSTDSAGTTKLDSIGYGRNFVSLNELSAVNNFLQGATFVFPEAVVCGDIEIRKQFSVMLLIERENEAAGFYSVAIVIFEGKLFEISSTRYGIP